MTAAWRARAWIAAVVVLSTACGRGQTKAGDAPPSARDAAGAQPTVSVPRTEQDETLWAHAKEGEPDELARLAHREGPSGLLERGDLPEWRKTVILALAYTDETTNLWVALPWLAGVADGADAEEALLAVETSAALAARPRRAVDPEDAMELRAGCERLSRVVKNEQRSKPVRVGAMRTLRMLAEYGCATPDDERDS